MGKEELGFAEDAKCRCRRILHRIEKLPPSTNITLSSKRTLRRLALSELSFLSSSSSSSPPSLPISVNIGHLEAVVHILEQPFVSGVSRVCKHIPLHPKDAYVDIVCSINGKPVWFIVSDRNPKHILWDDCGGNNCKAGLRQRIQRLLSAAASSLALRPSSLILFFSKGLSDAMLEKLQVEFGAQDVKIPFSQLDYDAAEEVEGDWINVTARSYELACILEIMIDPADQNEAALLQCHGSLEVIHDQCMLGRSKDIAKLSNTFASLVGLLKPLSSDEKESDLLVEGDLINFDTTALVALVSGISNGGTECLLAVPESELRQRFKGNYDFVIGQVQSEIQNPLHGEIREVISGKRGIICETVNREFNDLVSMCGGPNENLRARQLLNHLLVLPDNPSARIMSLPTTRKLGLKNKIVYGTGDRLHAPTLTANMAFVRAVSQTGLSLTTFEHRPRALTGD